MRLPPTGVLVIGGALLAGVIVYVAAKEGGDDSRDRDDDATSAESVGSTGAVMGSYSADDDYGAAGAGCPVTKTRVARAPGESDASPGWIEQNGLWINLGEKATIFATPRSGGASPPGTIPGDIGRDGSIRSKVPWFRDHRAWGRLRVSGQRRPGDEPLLRATLGNHLGPRSKVVPGALVFPREGCWQIRATSGGAKLAVVIWIVKSDEA